MPPDLQEWKPRDRGYKQPNTSWEYEEASAAHFWRLTPWQFDARPQEEKAKMLAYRLAYHTLEAWNYEQAERNAERESGNMGRGSSR